MWDEPVSPKPHSGDGGLNTAIDEVAREMTEGAPADAAAFRRRVLARVETGAAPRRSWRAAFVLSPLAAAAAIVVALLVARGLPGRHPATEHTPSAPREIAQTPPSAGAAGAPDTAAPSVSAHAADAPRGSARLAAAREPGPSEPGPSAPAPLEPNDVTPIAVAPLAVAALSPDPIPIDPLDAVTPLTVARIDITDMPRRFE